MQQAYEEGKKRFHHSKLYIDGVLQKCQKYLSFYRVFFLYFLVIYTVDELNELSSWLHFCQ